MIDNNIYKQRLVEIANLEIDCKIGKDRHFIAADRKNKWRIYLGIFAVIGSAIIASGIGSSLIKFLDSYFSSTPSWSNLSAVLSHIFPLLVGISTSIIGFLGLEKQTAQHRYVGNAYIDIARKSRSILNSITPENYNEKIKDFDGLVAKYSEINKDGETSPTNNTDSKKAMAMNKKNRALIKGKISYFDQQHLELPKIKQKKQIKLHECILKGIKYKLSTFLACLGIIRKRDYILYLKTISQ